MLASRCSFLLLAAAVAATVGSATAQDPAIDLPHERVEIPPGSAAEPVAVKTKAPMVPAYIGQGLSLLAAGENWQAAGSFREVVHRDPDSAIGYLGLALATQSYPRTAAKYVWLSYGHRDTAAPVERRIVEAYARCYAAKDRPKASDPAFDSAPSAQRLDVLRADLTRIAGDQPDSLIAARLADLQRNPHSKASSAPVTPTNGGHDQDLARLPRHPRFDARHAPWQPRNAPGFDLVRGLGGRRDFELYKGKPLLVVFFLGFG